MADSERKFRKLGFIFAFIAVFGFTAAAGPNEQSTTAPPEAVVVQTLAKSTTSWEGTTLPPYPKGQPEVSILRIHVPVGVKLPMHAHPVINAGVVISGELTVVTEADETLILSAGDAIIEVVDKWHYGKNTGDVPVDIIVFYAGVVEVPVTVLKDDD